MVGPFGTQLEAQLAVLKDYARRTNRLLVAQTQDVK